MSASRKHCLPLLAFLGTTPGGAVAAWSWLFQLEVRPTHEDWRCISPMATPAGAAGSDARVLDVRFNSDASCLCAASHSGFSIYSCHPFKRRGEEGGGGIGHAEMLNVTSLVAIVGGGDRPAFSPRSLRLWNTKSKRWVQHSPAPDMSLPS